MAAVPPVGRPYGAPAANTARAKFSVASPSTVARPWRKAATAWPRMRSNSAAGKAGSVTVEAASRIASGKALFSAVTVTEPVFAPPPVWNWAPSRSIRSWSCGPVSRRVPSASSEPVSTASPALRGARAPSRRPR